MLYESMIFRVMFECILLFRMTADNIHTNIGILECHQQCALKFSLKAVFHEVLKVCINWLFRLSNSSCLEHSKTHQASFVLAMLVSVSSCECEICPNP